MVAAGFARRPATGARGVRRDEEIVKATAREYDPAVDGPTELVMVVRYDGRVIPDTDTVVRLATLLEQRSYGGVEIEIDQVQAIGPNGRLADCTFRVEGAREYDENYFAHPKVTVTFPDGHEEFAYYRIDGAA